MPVQFEEINAEITDERRREPDEPPSRTPDPLEVAEQIRHELALIEARRARLAAD
ncbi:MAG TPA: hypothetical protein VHN20_16005 [Beijerinckiaceae bacterium]|nr:hypothetical protein [Beijerinckiaceae bacterium]